MDHRGTLTAVRRSLHVLFVSLALLAPLVLAPLGAHADRIVSEHSRWTRDRSRIVTDVLIERDDGATEARTVTGGKVGDIRMITVHSTLDGLQLEFVRERTGTSKTPLHWQNSCVYLTPDVDGVTDIAGTQELDVLNQMLDHFALSLATCGYLAIVRDEPAQVESKYDGKNAILFREDRWCRPANDDAPEECYPMSSIAVTNIFHRDNPNADDDGVIFDADIELNAVDYAIAVCDPGTGSCATTGEGPFADLANTMAHELGHLFGLEHTCYDGATETVPTDDQGNSVPNCFPTQLLGAAVTDSTMYNFQDPAETKKATLSADDVAGLCAIYATADDPGTCRRALDHDDGWCAVAPPANRSRSSLPLGVLCQLAIGMLLTALVFIRRR